MNEWTEIAINTATTFHELIEIIEDALSHYFEFKYDNGKLYFRYRTDNDNTKE